MNKQQKHTQTHNQKKKNPPLEIVRMSINYLTSKISHKYKYIEEKHDIS